MTNKFDALQEVFEYPDNTSWIKVIEAIPEQRPAIGIRESHNGFEAVAGMYISTINNSALNEHIDGKQHNNHFENSTTEPTFNKYLKVLFSQLEPEQEIRIIHSGGRNGVGRSLFDTKIIAINKGDTSESCTENIIQLLGEIQLCLNSGISAFGVGFFNQPPELNHKSSNFYAKIEPVALEILEPQHSGMGYTNSSNHAKNIISKLCAPPREKPRALNSMVQSMNLLPAPVEVLITVRPIRLTNEQVQKTAEIVQLLSYQKFECIRYEDSEYSHGLINGDFIELIKIMLESWLAQTNGFSISCEVFSRQALSKTFLNILGAEIFQGRSVNISESPRLEQDVSEVSLQLQNAFHINYFLPPLFPSINSLADIGYQCHYINPRVELPAKGIILGDIQDQDRQVRFTAGDRSRHCYVMGATGAGKSTLLLNMIAQDIAAGEGVGLIDPHGDLFVEVLEAIPPSRLNDVVIIDPSDFSHAVSINLLEIKGANVTVERNFIINEINSMFEHIYNMKKVGGPMFEMHMRNALYLLMANPDVSALVDIVRLYNDKEFRDQLIQKCSDPMVLDFWKMAEGTSGENGLKNMAPYIVNKFTQFIQNDLIRPIISQPKSTIDFRNIIDKKKILLIRLPKGILGEFDAKFIGMLILAKLQVAAMGRANTVHYLRKPFYLYVDEFQNFTTDSMESMLAEARKYGLYLTLANQNMSQLNSSLIETIMGNVGTKLFMRVGSNDALEIEKHYKNVLDAQDLMSLPNYHVAGYLVTNNKPIPPIIFKTRSPFQRKLSISDIQTQIASIVKNSHQKYCRPVAEINEQIKLRRNK